MLAPEWRSRPLLRQSGMSEEDIDAAVRRGDFVRVARGIYVPRQVSDDLRRRSEAALATQRADAAISRRTAAVIRDFHWIPADWAGPTAPICVTAARDDLTRSSRAGLDRRLADLPADDVDEIDGLRVTSTARTAVDLARFEPRLLAVQILDGVLRFTTCTKADLLAVTERMVRVPHVKTARDRIALAAERVDSPQETWARLQIIDAGLPWPETCLTIEHAGILLAQGDLGYRRWLIWIEYDGADVHDPLRENGADQAKDRWLGGRGWYVMRLSKRDRADPYVFLRELAAAIADAPARVAALDPRKSPEVAQAHRLLGLA